MATTDTTTESISSWRQNQFMGLGFNISQSRQLAEATETTYVRTKTGVKLYESPLGVERVRKVLEAGCPMDLVLDIFL